MWARIKRLFRSFLGWFVDLAEDPEEQADATNVDATHSLSAQLDTWSSNLILRRTFEEGDRVILSDDAIEALREIGYVE